LEHLLELSLRNGVVAGVIGVAAGAWSDPGAIGVGTAALLVGVWLVGRDLPSVEDALRAVSADSDR